jgi:hypothetical protein
MTTINESSKSITYFLKKQTGEFDWDDGPSVGGNRPYETVFETFFTAKGWKKIRGIREYFPQD